MGIPMRNNDPHPKVKAIIESLKGQGAEPRTMIRAAGKRGHELKKIARAKEGRPFLLSQMGAGLMPPGRVHLSARQCENTSRNGGRAVPGGAVRCREDQSKRT